MKKHQQVIAICGYKNNGKTTLIEGVLPFLTEAGLRVAVIKHHSHGMNPDTPGTDTWKFLHAGAYATVLSDLHTSTIVKKEETDDIKLVSAFPEADIILLEGYKQSNWPKIEVVRNRKVLICDPSQLIALVTDIDFSLDGVPIFRPFDHMALAEFLIERQERIISSAC
jgi:molybdopterin-guanine dinucleotide biosynthesis protein B